MRKTLIWDLPTRLFHWLLVLCIAGAWITGEKGAFDWHMRFGYGVLGLVLFRILWGLIGSDTARFIQFVRGPAAILHHIRELRAPGRLAPHAGHNALGALAVLGLLLVVGMQAVSGLFTSDGIMTDGPLVEHVSGATASLMRTIHLNNFNILLAIAGLHIVAILVYALWKRLDLVRPMVTGWVTLPASHPAPRIVSLVRALVVAAISATTIWALVSFA
ncbi:cytochrome b/b6 domain-containing protein [Niveispirillum sp. KHB5.9]|uniref:cytochrome b/b6 domain-containing protein n=1 Tax=Niveispirillum sp. KHB5.9 TaxID=3400269 RepID=UPI003A83D46F